jgi:hypothetical protein
MWDQTTLRIGGVVVIGRSRAEMKAYNKKGPPTEPARESNLAASKEK